MLISHFYATRLAFRRRGTSQSDRVKWLRSVRYVPIRFVALASFPLWFAFFKEGLHTFFLVFCIEEQVKTFAFKG